MICQPDRRRTKMNMKMLHQMSTFHCWLIHNLHLPTPWMSHGWVDSSSPRYSGFMWEYTNISDEYYHHYYCNTNVPLNGWNSFKINVGTWGNFCAVEVWNTEGVRLRSLEGSLGPNAGKWSWKIYIPSSYHKYTIDYIMLRWHSASGNHGDSDPDAWYQLSLNWYYVYNWPIV